MAVNQHHFEQFVQSIFRAEEHELLCSEFFARLPRYVDLEIAGQDAAASMPDVRHHFGQCPECHEVYLALRDAVRTDPASDTP